MSTYSLFLDHTSPFNYYPYGDLKAGWAPWNDVTGGYDPNKNQSDVPSGRSSHRTQQDNAGVELYFTGSSITLFGEVDQCNLDIWLDGSSSNGSPGNGRLAEFTDLERKEHRILMAVHPFNNGSISFYGAQIDAPVESASSASLGDADISVNYDVDWVDRTASGTALGDYHETTKQGASINVTLHQAAAVTVYGIRNLNAGKYNVSIDDAPPTTHIAKSSFETRSILYFAADLDPSVDHHLVLTNIEEGSQFAISSVNVTTLTNLNNVDTSGSFSVPRGTAIALITATVAACLILAVILVCLFMRRRRRRAQRLARRQQMAATPREVPSFIMKDEAVTKSRHDTVILVAGSHTYSYDGSLYPGDDEDAGDDEGDEDDGSFQFVQRPLLGHTPSIRMPNLGPSFHVDFPSVSSVQQQSRKSSKRSTLNAEHTQEQPMNRDTSDQTNFLHLQDSSGSTGDAHSRHGHGRPSYERERHRSRVRFSTPPILAQLFRHPFAWVSGGQASRSNRRSSQRSIPRTSIGDEPTTPMTADSVPFTVGTSVAFEHPESTPPRSLEAGEESTSDARDIEEGLATGATDTDGFIPHSARPWRVVSG